MTHVQRSGSCGTPRPESPAAHGRPMATPNRQICAQMMAHFTALLAIHTRRYARPPIRMTMLNAGSLRPLLTYSPTHKYTNFATPSIRHVSERCPVSDISARCHRIRPVCVSVPSSRPEGSPADRTTIRARALDQDEGLSMPLTALGTTGPDQLTRRLPDHDRSPAATATRVLIA